jgi:hypothetical protein
VVTSKFHNSSSSPIPLIFLLSDIIWPDYQFNVSPDVTLNEAAAGSSSSDTSLSALTKRNYVIQLIFILDKTKDDFTTGQYIGESVNKINSG